MNPIRLCPGPARTPPRRLDQVLPLDKTGKRLPGINDVKLAVIEGGPHVIRLTRANQVNTALLGFLRS